MENNKKNLISAIIFQISSIISGLILPRMILSAFGSEVNGLISSITQFLSFVALLEGGLGAVVLAELYKPIEEKNNELICKILDACQQFFRRIAGIFFVFTIILAIVYPFTISNRFSFGFTSTLVMILSISILSQYLFAITNKLLLQADQKVYICNLVHTTTIILNVIVTIIVLNFWKNIHIVKLISSLVFLIQPLIYNQYVKKKYKFDLLNVRKRLEHKYYFKERWSGFAQNLAHFVNMNIDIILISLFLGLTEVSVYSIYMLSIVALRSLITTASNSYQSTLGKHLTQNNEKKLRYVFDNFDIVSIAGSLILFCSCLILINPFVLFYTFGVDDVSYYRPIFALVILLANLVYSIREPYRILILAAGKFRETNFGSILEAIINLAISVLLLNFIGLTGLAIGTFVAITYRYLYFVYYLKRNIINMDFRSYLKRLIMVCIFVSVNIFFYFKLKIVIDSLFQFCIYGIITVAIEIIFFMILFLIFENHKANELLIRIKQIFKRR